jgi:hypothetical protein
MIAWKRAALVGFASWLIPFVISFLIFPLKKSNAPLFETLMTLVVLITAGVLFQLYFRGRAVSIHEALLVGVMWFVVNLMLDYPDSGPRGWHASETVHRTGLPRAHRASTGIHPAASG